MIKLLVIYLAILNLLSLFLMAADKHRAQKHRWRIPERSLFLAALLGGSLGAIVGMYLFHHKTKHWYFVVGMPLILLFQLVVAFGIARLVLAN